MDEVYLAVYPSIHDVMRAESLLNRVGIRCRLVPTPTSVRPDCGMVVSIGPEVARRALETLGEAGAPPQSVYYRDASGRLRDADSDLSAPEDS